MNVVDTERFLCISLPLPFQNILLRRPIFGFVSHIIKNSSQTLLLGNQSNMELTDDMFAV